ncbi:hypothetical protein Tco_0766728 [Tanacetum coccineum]
MGGYKSQRKTSFSFSGIFKHKKSQTGGEDTWEDSIKAYKVYPSDQDRAGCWADPRIDNKASAYIDTITNKWNHVEKGKMIANHDACIIKLLKEVNSRAKIQSHKTRNSNKPIDQKSHTQKSGRQIFTRHRFSPNKTSAVYEKTSPRSDLRWKPTGRIFKFVGLRWIPTGKLFDSCTSKVDSEPTHGSNVDIPNIYESKQTLDLSAGTSINVQKEQSFDLSAGTLCNVNKENLRVWLLKKLISQKPVLNLAPQCQQKFIKQPETAQQRQNELDLLFEEVKWNNPLFDEHFNGKIKVCLTNLSGVTTTDASNKHQQQPDSTSSTSTLATTVTANENFDL